MTAVAGIAVTPTVHTRALKVIQTCGFLLTDETADNAYPDIKFEVLLENIGNMLSKRKIREILTVCEECYDATDSHEVLSTRMASRFGYLSSSLAKTRFAEN